MAGISRRGFALGAGLGAGLGVAAARAGVAPRPAGASTVTSAPRADLGGHVVAVRRRGDGAAPSEVAVFDLAAGASPSDLSAPVDVLWPVRGTTYGTGLRPGPAEVPVVVEAVSGAVTELTPAPGTTFPQYHAPFPNPAALARQPDRWALLTSSDLVTYLVDLRDATARFLAAAVGSDDPYFQAAELTPDLGRLVLGSSSIVALLDLETAEVLRDFSGGNGNGSPAVSPGGTRVAFTQWTGEGDAVEVRVADVEGEGRAEVALVDETGDVSLRWASDDRLFVARGVPSRGTNAVEVLEVASGTRSMVKGDLGPGLDRLHVLAGGDRVLVRTWPSDVPTWHLLEVETLSAAPLPDVEGMRLEGTPGRAARAALFGSDTGIDRSGRGDRFVVIDLATGATTLTLDHLPGQYHLAADLGPDPDLAAVTVSGPVAADELWLVDLLSGRLVVVPGRRDARFSPDGRSVLVREEGANLEILDRSGATLRDLGHFDVGFWLG